jgi:branched-chain amino acid transport system substrate-binding protein
MAVEVAAATATGRGRRSTLGGAGMMHHRRTFLKATAAGLAASSGMFRGFAHAADAGTINVGGLHDISGNFQLFGTTKANVLKLAVDQTNAAGGLLGKQIRLVDYDTQSNNQLYAQYAQQLGLKDRVAVVHGGLTSSSREVVRPILRRSNTLYFYNMPYEGGVCDRNIFITGTTPGQLLATLVPYLIERFGKKIYVLGADYNFGQLSAKWTAKIAKEHGGEVVGTEFFPLDVNNFGATIANIQAAKPDAVVNTFVGPAHASFYGQWAAAGMKGRIALASQTYGEVGEHIAMPQEVSEGIIVSYSYVDEIDTPANKAFLDQYRAKYGPRFYISDLGMATLIGWKMWEAAVRKAGSIDRLKVTQALESGIEVDTPSGKVRMDGATHHCVMTMYLCEVKNRKFEILKTFRNVPPSDTAGVCDLLRHPDTNAQFEPKL